jgi:hypothetical protein
LARGTTGATASCLPKPSRANLDKWEPARDRRSAGALDLWHGRQTRAHDDLEIAIPRSYFADVRKAFTGFEFFTASNGTLSAEPPTIDQHQNWVLDPIARVWRVDIFLEPGDESTWIYRRNPSLQLPRAQPPSSCCCSKRKRRDRRTS